MTLLFGVIFVGCLFLALALLWWLHRLLARPAAGADAVPVAGGAESAERLERELAGARRELRRARQRHRSLLEDAPVPLWILDLSAVKTYLEEIVGAGVEDLGEHLRTNQWDVVRSIELLRVCEVNRAAVELFGANDRDELASSLARVIGTESGPSLVELLLAVARGERVAEMEMKLDALRGGTRHVSLRLSVPDGEYSRALVSTVDLTERQEMMANLTRADRMASLGVLASGVAHEINNPLAYLLLNLESLVEDLPRRDDPELEEDLLARVREGIDGARRVRDIVRQLKTFARDDKGRRFPVSVNEALECAINMARSTIRFRARLVKELGDVPEVNASDGALSQVFLNLLVNAADAIREGDVAGNEIRVRTWRRDNDVLVEVRDTGRGIADEHMGRLFDPFYTTKALGEGAGLGLSVCYNIVKALDGVIHVESAPGRGTRVVVRLPADDLVRRTPSHENPTLDRSDEGIGGRVLIIDDEPLVVRTLRRLLVRGHTVVVAESGAAGREILEQDQDFAVILCDLMMPDVSGMELHAWIEAQRPELVGRMVFMSGGACSPRASEFLDSVSAECLCKPFHHAQVEELVQRYVASHQPTAAGVSRLRAVS